MEDKNFEIKLRCVFCGYDKFDLPYEGYQPQDGEQIICPNCGQSNDYSSLRQLAIKEGHEKIKEYAVGEIRKMLKKFKK